MDLNRKLQEVCKGFCINDPYIGYELIQVGNVNKTYRVMVRLPDGTPKSFLVQNVNTYVFKDPINMMENIDLVTEHIRKKRPGKIALHFHHTADRKTYIVDGDNFWRMTNYIPSMTLSVAKEMDLVRNAGRAFGEFQMQLADFDSSKLHETIANFHNTDKRYEALEQTVAEDPVGLAAQVQEELEYLRSVRHEACTLVRLYQEGKLPQRVTHNDTKINNVLFDANTHEALVVVDLDTVMPGVVGHDFGDAIRFAANYVEEDCLDYMKAGVDMNIFRSFAEGFLEMTADTLTETEINTLALSCFCLTVELAVRFLDDYIKGSLYFKTLYPEHNLVRTRCQIALARDIHAKMALMQECIDKCLEK